MREVDVEAVVQRRLIEKQYFWFELQRCTESDTSI